MPNGNWILAEACGQMRAWHARFPGYGACLSVSINLSARQLGTTAPPLLLLPAVDTVLENCGLFAHGLHLEVTETCLMEVDGAASVLSDLSARGIHITLDDFGTGYSSLAYLHRFPITHLKIDRSLVPELSSWDEEAAIVTMAQSLNIAVVAERIETPEHLSVLRTLGCDFGQGYLFSPPLTGRDTEALLARARLVTPRRRDRMKVSAFPKLRFGRTGRTSQRAFRFPVPRVAPLLRPPIHTTEGFSP